MGVVFSARIHPGETNSSWMMHGILKYLVSEHKHAKVMSWIGLPLDLDYLVLKTTFCVQDSTND